MFMVCDTKSGRYCTDLIVAAYTRKQQPSLCTCKMLQ